jgi:hypothetical protein
MYASYPMSADDVRYELRYEPSHARRVGEQCGYAFGCDAKGNVDMNQLSEHARDAYLYARVVVGAEFLTPVITVVA